MKNSCLQTRSNMDQYSLHERVYFKSGRTGIPFNLDVHRKEIRVTPLLNAGGYQEREQKH